MHLVFLGSVDLSDESVLSGTPTYIIRTLRDQSHEVSVIGPLESRGIRKVWERLKWRYYHHVFHKKYTVAHDAGSMRGLGAYASKLLRQGKKADAVIVYTLPDAAYLTCDAPLILIHDATWHQLLDYYPGLERSVIVPETIEGGCQLDRLALTNCDRAVYACRWAADSAVHDYAVPKEKIRIINFGANLVSPPAIADVKRWVAARGRLPCRLLFIAAEWTRKGGDIAIAVAENLHRRGLPVELQVVGSAPAGPVPDFVRLFGRLSKDEPAQAQQLEQLFAEADFLILPTRAECYGIVFCEAAAYAVPVAGTDTGGVTDVIRDETWGKAFAYNAAPAEYADWLAAAYSDRERYETMCFAARKDFEERLNWDVFCSELVGVVNELTIRSEGKTSLR